MNGCLVALETDGFQMNRKFYYYNIPMCKKALITLLSGVLFLLTSCIDHNYDLANKEIATDVKIEGNTIALPVGDLKPIVLDSLIDVDAIEILDKNANGVYSISMDSTISFEESIDSITLDIKPVEHNTPIEFEEVNIDTIHIEASNAEKAQFKTPTISFEELNENLPELKPEDVKRGFDIESYLEELKGEDESVESIPVHVKSNVSTDEQYVSCDFSYELPKDVATINSIKLGSDADDKGTLVQVVVTNPKALMDIEKSIKFNITFPDYFRLAVNENVEQWKKYDVIDGNCVKAEGLTPKGETTLISFYITELVDVDEKIVDGRIDIRENIVYEIDYEAEGDVELTREMTADDFAFNVSLYSKLSFLDVAGSTKDIEVRFKPIDMDFSCDVNDIEHIDTIKYVEFDESVSRIKFETLMGMDWLSAFDLKKDYALRISFPDSLEISHGNSEYDGKGSDKIVYNEKEHAFYVYDLDLLASSHWNLALKKLTLDTPVKNGVFHKDVKADIRFVSPEKSDTAGYFKLAGTYMESMVKVLDKLSGVKEATFTMTGSDLVVKDAVVHTEVVKSDLGTETKFTLNEEVPGEIGRIEKIGFQNDVEMTFDLIVQGLETLDTDIDLDIRVQLPSFLQLKPLDKSVGITVNSGILDIDTTYNPSSVEPLRLKLLCTGIDFMNEEFNYNGLMPKDSTDGNSYISYSSDIVVEGEASIHGADFHSTALENDIAFNVEVALDKIVVEKFHGLYNAEIDSIEEKIELDLGEGLEFLREEDNSITLADPQFEFVLKNTIGVPVAIDLQIFGTDENGAVIEESEIISTLNIKPAEYDEQNDELKPVETKLFLISNKNTSKAGYENIEIPNLANLLKRIPHSINIKINPIIKTDVTHHVDISEPIKLEGAYSVVVPLKFEDFHLCYNDTISGLQASIGETFDMFSNVALCAKMDIINTIPLGLSLNIVPLDEDGNKIDDIEIDTLTIEAGSGENVVNEDGTVGEDLVAQKFSFAIKSKSGDISALDKLALSIEAATDHTTGSAGLEGGQGIKISNILFELSGDVEIELGK